MDWVWSIREKNFSATEKEDKWLKLNGNNVGSKAMEGKSLTPLNKYNFYLLKDCFE